MKFKLLTMIFGSILSLKAISSIKPITEMELIESSKTEKIPQIETIEASWLAAKSEEQMISDRFAPELYAGAKTQETHEKALIQFQPIFSPTKQAQIGIKKATSFGMTSDLSVGTDQRSANSPFAGRFNEVTTTTAQLSLTFDLWKDFWGKISKAEIESTNLNQERANIEKELQSQAFTVTIRRIFWTLVANDKMMKVSLNLLETAKKQAQDSRVRLNNSVSDIAEVSRYEAQVASKEANILNLKYQKEGIIKQLKQLLPQYNSHQIELDKYDLDQTVADVLACTAVIGSKSKTPYEFTKYDEMISLLKLIKEQKLKIANSYDAADLKLIGAVKATGVSSNKPDSNENYYRGSFGDSYDDGVGHNRTGYSVGLNWSLPLGNQSKTKETKVLVEEKKLQANIDNTEAILDSTHDQLVNSINLLTTMIKTQKLHTQLLEKRLKEMTKKYMQARISVNDLIQDQNDYFNSNLSVINTELQILNTLFDYLVIFNQTPCTFNRI
jgi:outer membrane protein TolC